MNTVGVIIIIHSAYCRVCQYVRSLWISKYFVYGCFIRAKCIIRYLDPVSSVLSRLLLISAAFVCWEWLSWWLMPVRVFGRGYNADVLMERLHNLNSYKNLWNWTKPTETSRISVVRDVADQFWGWQQLTNYRDPEKKIGALGGDILKKQRFFENTQNNDNLVSPPGEWNGKIEIL